MIFIAALCSVSHKLSLSLPKVPPPHVELIARTGHPPSHLCYYTTSCHTSPHLKQKRRPFGRLKIDYPNLVVDGWVNCQPPPGGSFFHCWYLQLDSYPASKGRMGRWQTNIIASHSDTMTGVSDIIHNLECGKLFFVEGPGGQPTIIT